MYVHLYLNKNYKEVQNIIYLNRTVKSKLKYDIISYTQDMNLIIIKYLVTLITT